MRRAASVLAVLLFAGCATEPPDTAARCPEDTRSLGFSVPLGFGLTIGESSLKAGFNAIRTYFDQRPAATGPADKAQAAELAANAAAEAAPPMNEDQKRELRVHAGQWVDTYTEKCKPGVR